MRARHSDPTDEHVGKRIRMRRHVLGMSQQALAGELGLTFQQVQNYERGANPVGAGRLQQLSAVLRVPVSFFFEGAPQLAGKARRRAEAPSPAYITDFLASADGHALARSFVQVRTAVIRHSIVRLVEMVAAHGL